MLLSIILFLFWAKLTEEFSDMPGADKYFKIINFTLLGIFIYVFIVNAWMCDDAYITLRAADNFVKGFGPVWNVGERAQAFTHPLWASALSFFYFFSREAYFTALFVSLLFSAGAVYIFLFKISSNAKTSVILFGILISSRAFVDYTSSGLENPLSYFLFALLFYSVTQEKIFFNYLRKLFYISLISSLIALNRLDHILLILPIFAYEYISNARRLNMPLRKYLKTVFYGFAPIWLWEVFSLFYYGFPFPNTYYAKLYTGIPLNEYIAQGWRYFENSAVNDPLTLLFTAFVIICAIIIFIKKRKFILITFAAGIVLYMLYIIKIGGDFMSGRFFSVPFLLSLLLSASIAPEFKKGKFLFAATAVTGLILASSFIAGYHPIMGGANYPSSNANNLYETLTAYPDKYGINDERGFYFAHCGLINVIAKGHLSPDLDWAKMGKETSRSEQKYFVRGAIGIFSYYAGQEKHIIDMYGLSDPLLARLPVAKDPFNPGMKWRIGHFYRKLPAGYMESLISGKNLIKDKNLAEYFDKLKIVTQGSLFSAERLGAIIGFLFGSYDGLPPSSGDEYTDETLPYPYGGDSKSMTTYHLQLADMSRAEKDIERAFNGYSKALSYAATPADSMDALEAISALFTEIGQPERAEDYLSAMIQINPKDIHLIDAGRTIAAVYYSKGNPKGAVKILEKILRFFPNEGLIFSDIGSYHYHSGDKEAAVKAWKEGASAQPDFAQNYYNLFAYYYNDIKNMKMAYKFALEYEQRGGKIPAEILKSLGGEAGKM